VEGAQLEAAMRENWGCCGERKAVSAILPGGGAKNHRVSLKKGHPPLRVGVGPEMLSPGGYDHSISHS
jgi:hypothetical protein